MMYSIPVSKISKLEKIFNRYIKKGANLTLNIGDEVIEDGTLYVDDPENHTMHSVSIKITCKQVYVDGTYIINGWQFVGTIEFTDNGNIIRLADSSFEGKIPLKYLHTPKICEHCGKIRNRKDTYLIYNIDSGEFKQVGSTCLLEYTQGLDADKCADIMSCLTKFASLADKDVFEDEFLGNGYDATWCGMNREYALSFIISYVRRYGYTRMFEGQGTAHDVWVCINGGLHDEEMTRRYESIKPASDEELKAIDDYAREHLNDDFGYMRNASLSWLKSGIEYRDFGLVSSFVVTYDKAMQKEELKKSKLVDKNNEWVGNVGDRITVAIKSFRLLYSSSYEVAWHTYANSYTYEIIDNEGHTFILKSSKQLDMEYVEVSYEEQLEGKQEGWKELGKPVELIATIKEHSTYNYVKQTVLTRAKVTKRAE